VRRRVVLADEWFEMIDAPCARRFDFAGAGHRPHFDDSEQFADLMARALAESQRYTGQGD